MNNVFGKDKKDNKKNVSLTEGNFREMMKKREQQLPIIENNIREALEDYSGQNMCLIVINEDENGDPEGASVVMAGVSTMETQIKMSQVLHKLSNKSMEILMESASGNLPAMLQIATALAESDDMDEEDEEPKKKKGKK